MIKRTKGEINRFYFENNYFQISYRIKKSGLDFNKFVIDPQFGVVTTAAMFDREAKKEYYITVVAEDGAKSDRPNHYPPGTPNQGTVDLTQDACCCLAMFASLRHFCLYYRGG